METVLTAGGQAVQGMVSSGLRVVTFEVGSACVDQSLVADVRPVDLQCKGGEAVVSEWSRSAVSSDRSVTPLEQPPVGQVEHPREQLCSGISVDRPVASVDSPVTLYQQSDETYTHQYKAKCNSQVYSIAEYSFQSSLAVKGFIQLLVEKKRFSLASIKRSVHQVLVRDRKSAIGHQVLRKPSGNHVKEMFDPVLFRAGKFAVPSDLRVERFVERHRHSCVKCTALETGIAVDCYFAPMLECIAKGWHPPINEKEIRPVHRVREGNYPGVRLYGESTFDEFHKMLKHNVLTEAPYRLPGSVRSPQGVVVKSSDKVRARMLVGIEIVDQKSMDKANEKLLALGHPRVKARMTLDMTATGLNRAAYSPAFSYPSLQDGIRMIFRNCYIGKCDVSRYFHSFPLAYETRHLFEVEFDGVVYVYARCPFGFTACPYYASTWSAEFKSWLTSLGVETAHLMDDWLVVKETERKVKVELGKVVEVFEDVGFSLAVEKNEVGQCLTFLGVHLDSINMTMRFDATQARGMKLEFQFYLNSLLAGVLLDHTTIRRVCGILNWYSEVVQSGRMHTRSWWTYEKYGASMFESAHRALVADTQWWISLLQSWENSLSSNVEYSILSADELLRNKRSIMIVQSDASGTDGFGYYYGFAQSQELSWVSKRWPPARVLVSSHVDELAALCDFLECSCTVVDAVLVWVTDSESAMWSVNKGRCFEPEGLELLRRILCQCDVFRLQIIALWVPRELNDLADYLSHLSFSVDRDQVSGTWTADELFSGVSGMAHRQHQETQGDHQHLQEIRGGMSADPQTTFPSQSPSSVEVSAGFCEGQSRLHEVHPSDPLLPQSVRTLQSPQVVERGRSIQSQGGGQAAPAARPVSGQAGQATHHLVDRRDGQHHGSQRFTRADGGDVNDRRPRQSHAVRRAAKRAQSVRL